MLAKIFLVALAASPLVAAHGKIAVITGDAGGNTTALGILGASVAGAGTNKQTEIDTTVFNSKAAASDGLGKTKNGPNTLAGMSAVMQQSGTTLAQVSPGGSLSGTVHIVTTDGAGPYTAIVDPTGTGAFSQGTKLDVTKQVPGKNGNIAAPKQRRFVTRMLVNMGIVKRAANVNENYSFTATVPAGMACTGTVAGQSNVCLVKIVNPSNAGPFGGVIAMQMAGAGGNATAGTGGGATAGAGTGTAGTAGTGATGNAGTGATGNAGANAGANDAATGKGATGKGAKQAAKQATKFRA